MQDLVEEQRRKLGFCFGGEVVGEGRGGGGVQIPEPICCQHKHTKIGK